MLLTKLPQKASLPVALASSATLSCLPLLTTLLLLLFALACLPLACLLQPGEAGAAYGVSHLQSTVPPAMFLTPGLYPSPCCSSCLLQPGEAGAQYGVSPLRRLKEMAIKQTTGAQMKLESTGRSLDIASKRLIRV
jgi:hypothetical protein